MDPVHRTMSYTEKIDVLDLIIEILQEHEKTLDQLVGRLETVVHVDHGPDPAADQRRRFYEPL